MNRSFALRSAFVSLACSLGLLGVLLGLPTLASAQTEGFVPVADAPAEAPAQASADPVAQGEPQDVAENIGSDANAASTSLNYTFIDLIKFGGWVGYIIICLSIAAVSLIVQYAISIRAARVIPQADLKQLTDAVAKGKYKEVAEAAAGNRASYITRVVAAGVREEDRGYDAVVKGMEDAADNATGVLLRRIEHLNIIANIAPMLGLLGTVIGMVNSFNQISIAVGGVDPRRLAGGIFEALMTTVMGLIVAIPSLYMFGVFRNRVDALAAEAADAAESIVEPLKRRPPTTGTNH